MIWLQKIKARTKSLRLEVYALYFAMLHVRTLWYAKALAAGVILYALSPIDLIPDPIPVLGYLDDVILIPLGVVIVRKLIPDVVMEACRVKAMAAAPVARDWRIAGGVLVVTIWLICLAVLTAAGWAWFIK